MPKKAGRKGGGGKQAGMTEEERLLYQQQKAQAEDEITRRKEDMLAQFLKVCVNGFESRISANVLLKMRFSSRPLRFLSSRINWRRRRRTLR